MSVIAFLLLLSFFASLTSLVVEAAKKIIDEKENRSNNLIALCSALIIGFVGTLTYFYFTNEVLGMTQFIFAIFMGLASGLVSMTSYDKVKDLLSQLDKK